jgi:AcrR family transcriptional regulator
MTRSASLFFQGHELDSFLLAPIGEEKNGILLSILSALARKDIDPWQEAARLSRLPRAVATDSLCAMIAALPPGVAHPADPRSIAERLIALLPAGGVGESPPRRTPIVAVVTTQPDAVKYIVAMVLVLGLLTVFAGLRQPATVEGVHMQTSSVAVPPAGLPPLGY